MAEMNKNEFYLDDVNVTEARYDVRLKKLELDQFRCFDKLEISFEERLTVIIAENGGGKTAILDAIAGCLKNFLSEFYVDGYQRTQMPIRDVKIGTKTGECKLTADIEYLYNSFEEAREDEEGNIIEDETLKTKGRADTNLILSNSYGDYQSPFVEEVEENLIPFSVYEKENIGKKINFPVLAYFGGETVKIVDVDKNENIKRLKNIYENALEGNRLHYSNFYNWWFYSYYEMLENIDKNLNFDESAVVIANNINEGEYENDETFIRISNNLKKINAAVEYLLNDDPKKPIYKKLWIKKVHGKFVMGMNKITYSQDGQENVQPTEISQFSAGEKALFAYVADLGLRLLHANPLDVSVEKKDYLK
jgi:predicted ATP-binding protein involved in virulence